MINRACVAVWERFVLEEGNSYSTPVMNHLKGKFVQLPRERKKGRDFPCRNDSRSDAAEKIAPKK